MSIQRVIPDEKNLGDVEVTLITSFDPGGSEVTHGPFAAATPTDVRRSARQVRLKLTELNAAPWRVGVFRLAVRESARRGVASILRYSQDTFTDTNGTPLQNHTSLDGFGWSKYYTGGGTGGGWISSNQVYWNNVGAGSAFGGFVYGFLPSEVNTEVSADVSFTSSINDVVRIFAHGEKLGSPGQCEWHGLSLELRQGGQLILGRACIASVTQITSVATGAIANDVVKNMKLVITGTTVQGWLDGVKHIEVVTAFHPNAGTVGVYGLGGTSAGAQARMDNFTVRTSS